jgi:hypothetical protein
VHTGDAVKTSAQELGFATVSAMIFSVAVAVAVAVADSGAAAIAAGAATSH